MRNMVSKIMKKTAPIIAALFALLSCDKPFALDLPLAVDSREYNISSKAGQARIFFYTNRAWTLSVEPVDCSWGTVNKTSGNGKDDVEEIVFTHEQNTDTDREAVLVITAGDLQERIKIFQPGLAKEWWDGSTSVDDLVIKPQY